VIVAHRGYASKYPENTLEAFQAAVDAGCLWIEADVQLFEGVPVLSHDEPTGDEPLLARFADWLEARPDVTALVEFKTESLHDYGREVVVDAVMRTMRGNWHPISFDAEALSLAVAAGSRAPGWVVCQFGPNTQRQAAELGVRWLITNQIFMPETLPAGPWEWMVYEIANREQAENAISRGARWLETMAVGEMLAALSVGDLQSVAPEAGDLLSFGNHRRVYAHRTDPGLVVKVARNTLAALWQRDECLIWSMVAGTPLARFFCPVVWHSPDHMVSHQRRCEPPDASDHKKRPVQAWMAGDTELPNWARLDGRLVLVDYTGHLNAVRDQLRAE